MIELLLLAGLQKVDRSAATDSAVHEALLSPMNGYVMPGLSVAVSQRGKIVYARGVGVGSYSPQRRDWVPPGPGTLFRLGSISKPITALLVMKLVEQKRVGLDDDVRKYVPSYPDKGGTITVRQVLSHTSGIRHYQEGKSDGGHFERCEDALRVWARDPLLFPPGERYSYSTHAYTLLGAIVENVNGTWYDTVLDRVVRRPAGTRAPRVENRAIDGDRRAVLFAIGKDAFRQARPDDLSWKTSGGGLEATPTDLCKVGDALLGGKIVSLKSLLAMTTPVQPRTDRSSYGLGFVIGKGFFGHDGAQLGARSFWRVYPQQGTVVTVMSNYQGSEVGKLGDRIGKIWTGAP